MQYAFGKAVQMTQEQAIERVTQELAKEGFGVLSTFPPVLLES